MSLELKTLVKEAFDLLEARCTETAAGEVWLQAPLGGRAAALLGGRRERRLAFEKPAASDPALLVVPGCRLLEELTVELAAMGVARHGVVHADPRITRYGIEKRFNVFPETDRKLKMSAGFRTRLRCFFKAGIFGADHAEEMIGVEVPENGTPRPMGIEEPRPKGLRWARRPPLRWSDWMRKAESGFRTAEMLAREKAQAAQSEQLSRLYAELLRLRSYYTQLMHETAPGEEHDGARAQIEAEYRLRRDEEIRLAGVRVRLELIAVETLSDPVKNLKWTLARAGHTAEATACVSAVDGSIVEPVRCALCSQTTQIFGLSLQGAVMCAGCRSVCDRCGYESTGPEIARKRLCSICGRSVCMEHGFECRTCRRIACRDHLLQCAKGCRICPDCSRHCLDCQETVVWCREHCRTNASGQSVCLDHAVTCVGCRDYQPLSRSASCAVCGQSICESCRERCHGCGREFCLNHIEKGECQPCHEKRANCLAAGQ